jgi:signal transduction histidine kinase
VGAGVRRVAVVAVMVAMVLFAVPLALVSRSLLIEREQAELELAARTALTAVGTDIASKDPVELPPADPAVAVAVYSPDGVLRAGSGGRRAGRLAQVALGGNPTTGWESGRLLSAVPVVSNEKVTAVVQASEPGAAIWRQVALVWTVLLAAAATALGAAIVVARRQSARLVEPLEALAFASQQVSRGDLSVRAAQSRIPELDQLGRAHNTMVDNLVGLLERERHFAADASHQLRTPLTRLQLRLQMAHDNPDSARRELGEALQEVDQLQRTVDHILTAARGNRGGSLPSHAAAPLAEVVAVAEGRWHGPLATAGRQLRVRIDPALAREPVAGLVVSQVLEVLLENAATHGRGRVMVTVRESAGALVLEVADEGALDARIDPFERGLTTSRSGTGLGLALARTMAESIHARLVLTSRKPTTMSLFIPS